MSFRTSARDLKETVSLATPVIVAELGWMFMGVVDTLMVGGLGPEAIGAVGLGSILFLAIAVFAMGLLLGLDTFVSQAYGAGSLVECHRWLYHGIVLSALLALPITLLGWLAASTLPAWGINPDVHPITSAYIKVVNWSVAPLLFYMAFRRYLQSIGTVVPVMVALVSANLINVAINWLLINGNLGAPALGAVGAAWATVISRFYMMAFLLIAIIVHERRASTGLRETPLGVEFHRLALLVRLGGPAALQLVLEIGVFAAATVLAGRLDAASLATHQIALMAISVTFMIPLGLSSAGAVRVGHAIGRGDPEAAASAGWTAVALGLGFMALSALTMILIPTLLIRLFTSDPVVIAIGVSLLRVAAMFQLFDGLQVVTTGTLRGLGDTRTPMMANLVGHWVFGLPVAYILCFKAGWGVLGLWVGLSVGLIVVGLVLVRVWHGRVKLLTGGRR